MGGNRKNPGRSLEYAKAAVRIKLKKKKRKFFQLNLGFKTEFFEYDPRAFCLSELIACNASHQAGHPCCQGH